MNVRITAFRIVMVSGERVHVGLRDGDGHVYMAHAGPPLPAEPLTDERRIAFRVQPEIFPQIGPEGGDVIGRVDGWILV